MPFFANRTWVAPSGGVSKIEKRFQLVTIHAVAVVLDSNDKRIFPSNLLHFESKANIGCFGIKGIADSLSDEVKRISEVISYLDILLSSIDFGNK